MNQKIKNILFQNAISILNQLIQTPSFSREEDQTAAIIANFLTQKNINNERLKNNIWAKNKYFSPNKPTVLLISHHDTVRPNAGYTRNPFQATQEAGRLYGLGSNDAGGCLVSLLAAFLFFYEKENLPYNLVFAAVAEEEISGANGLELLFPSLPKIDCAIVGEPTQMQMAVAEKGLLVLDCKTTGKAGHAAREEGVNAIYLTMNAIKWFETYQFSQVSAHLGPIKMSVTSIETPNKAHNVVPDTCQFVVDLRLNDAIEMEEVLAIIRANVDCEVVPRSMRLKATKIVETHPLVLAGKSLGLLSFGSPTLSDKALLPIPALKLGPGDSARSHTADEYVFLEEIKAGIEGYIALIEKTMNH
jgi:acetylornithine deacetylase